MKIRKDRVVSIDYTIRLADGQVVESSTTGENTPLTYLHGRAQIVPGVEHAIEGAETGEIVEVVVPPDAAFGERDPGGVFAVPRAAFAVHEPIDVGMTFSATRTDGRSILFRIVEMRENAVVVDTNHPLAGQTLHVWVMVRTVREATETERVRGSVFTEEPAPLSS